MSLDIVPSVTLFPDQIAALNGLVRETNAFAIDISPAEHRSLRVVTLHRDADADDEDATCSARWWSVSIAGTVREQAQTPAEVAA